MMTLGFIVFGIRFLFSAMDLFGPSRRGQTWKDHFKGPLTLHFSLAAMAGLALKFKSEAPWSYAFGFLAALSIYSVLKSTFYKMDHQAPREKLMHGFELMLHPLVLMTLYGFWPFIQGVGLFANMVLPFSSDGIKPLTFGFSISMLTCFLAGLYTAWKGSKTQSSGSAIPNKSDLAA